MHEHVNVKRLNLNMDFVVQVLMAVGLNGQPGHKQIVRRSNMARNLSTRGQESAITHLLLTMERIVKDLRLKLRPNYVNFMCFEIRDFNVGLEF